jgi:hypothetical protein
MTYAYAGLLAVFLTTLFTPFGSARSVAMAIIGGFITVALLEHGPSIWNRMNEGQPLPALAFPWRMTIATAVAFTICCAGGRRTPRPAAAQM